MSRARFAPAVAAVLAADAEPPYSKRLRIGCSRIAARGDTSSDVSEEVDEL